MNRILFVRILALVVLLCTTALLCACSSSPEKSYALSETELTLMQSESRNLFVQRTDSGANADYTVSWSSSDPAVVTVDNEGRVTAVAQGTAEVKATVTVDGKTADFSCAVTVAENTTPLAAVSFASNLYSVGGGQQLDLRSELIFYPANAANKTLTWTTSNASIATVVDGVVTPVSEGAATITAAAGEEVRATCVVRVSALSVQATGISFSAKEYTTSMSQTLMLTADVTPANATGYSIVWSSSDPTVATVSGGAVTGHSAGTVTITAQLNGGASEQTATCKVTVTEETAEVKATRVTLSPSNINLMNGDRGQYAFHTTVIPANCTEEESWSVDKPELISIDPLTGKFSLIADLPDGEEQAAVIVTCTVGEVSDSKVVFVSRPAATLQMSTNEATLYTAGPLSFIELTAAITESNELPALVWTSSDPAVASVDETGKVTAVGKGECLITATVAQRPTLTAACRIVVEDPPYLVVEVGGTIELDRTKIPEDVTGWNLDTRYITFDAFTMQITGVRETVNGPVRIWAYSAANIDNIVSFDVYVMSKQS